MRVDNLGTFLQGIFLMVYKNSILRQMGKKRDDFFGTAASPVSRRIWFGTDSRSNETKMS